MYIYFKMNITCFSRFQEGMYGETVSILLQVMPTLHRIVDITFPYRNLYQLPLTYSILKVIYDPNGNILSRYFT